MKQLTEILQKAVAMEHDGERYYSQAAAQANNPLARSTFTSLAREKRRHTEMLQGYCDAVAQSGECPLPPTGDSASKILTDLVEGVFDSARELLGVEALPAEDLHQVYDTAIAMEREGLDKYTAWAEQTDEPHAAELFSYLVGQKRGHLALLEEGQKYLDDPDSWHFEQEHWIVEG